MIARATMIPRGPFAVCGGRPSAAEEYESRFARRQRKVAENLPEIPALRNFGHFEN